MKLTVCPSALLCSDLSDTQFLRMGVFHSAIAGTQSRGMAESLQSFLVDQTFTHAMLTAHLSDGKFQVPPYFPQAPVQGPDQPLGL